MDHLRRRILLILAAFPTLIAVGTLGFVLVEHYSWFDAFYMTVITITTVGYLEVRPLTQAGRIFNSAFLLIGVSTVLLAIGAMTQTIIELELGNFFLKRRLKKVVERMQNHFIICGFGRVGRGAAAELQLAGVEFVVVDRNPDRVARAQKAGMIAIQADSTQDATLHEVNINKARGLVAALATDADNLFLILSAKALNPMLNVATRVAEEESEVKLRRAGADIVFAPYSVAGHRLAQSLIRPHVYEFLDFTTKNMGLDVRIEQVKVSPSSSVASKTLAEAGVRRDLGIIVLAIRKEGSMMFNPSADTMINPGDFLIAMGPPDKLEQLERLVEAAAR